MKHLARILAVGLLLALPVPVSAQPAAEVSSEDPLLGTWHLDISKSTYRPGPPPRTQIRIYEKHRFGIRGTVKTVYADGRSTTVQSIFDYDKQEHPITGSEDVDAIVVTRTDAYIHEATLSHAGIRVGTFRREISRDGRRMTVTLQRRNPPTDNVEVYQKVVDDQ